MTEKDSKFLIKYILINHIEIFIAGISQQYCFHIEEAKFQWYNKYGVLKVQKLSTGFLYCKGECLIYVQYRGTVS